LVTSDYITSADRNKLINVRSNDKCSLYMNSRMNKNNFFILECDFFSKRS